MSFSKGSKQNQSLFRTLEQQPYSNQVCTRFLLRQKLLTQLKPEKKFSDPSSLVGCLVGLEYKPDGKLIASTTAQKIRVWDAETGALKKSLQDDERIITSLSWFHSVSDSFFTSSLDKTIRLWKHYKPVATYRDQTEWVRSLQLSRDDALLLSGCVSSQICGWDVERSRVLFRIESANVRPDAEFNSVDSLQFSHGSPNIFICGSRDGVAKIWDQRCLHANKPVISFLAHTMKLNHVTFNFSDTRVLSGGRDGKIKLWDLRALSAPTCLGKSGLVREYCGHSCASYNVSCCFYNGERHILTGSEDRFIYIYDTLTGHIAAKLDSFNSVVNIVQTAPFCDPLKFVSSGIDDTQIIMWYPRGRGEGEEEEEEGVREPSREGQPRGSKVGGYRSRVELTIFNTHQRCIERLMQKHGDQMVRLFQGQNFSVSAHQSWSEIVRSQSDTRSQDLLRLVGASAHDFTTALEMARRPFEAYIRSGRFRWHRPAAGASRSSWSSAGIVRRSSIEEAADFNMIEASVSSIRLSEADVFNQDPFRLEPLTRDFLSCTFEDIKFMFYERHVRREKIYQARQAYRENRAALPLTLSVSFSGDSSTVVDVNSRG